MTVKGFAAYETIGISIPNPRPVTRMPVPKDLTPEQLARLDAAFAELEAEQMAEMAAQLKDEETR